MENKDYVQYGNYIKDWCNKKMVVQYDNLALYFSYFMNEK